MPRTITTMVTVFTFDELSDDAKTKAVSYIRDKLAGDWWDSGDIDDISQTIIWNLAHTLGTPEHDKYGEGDFPGIGGVELVEWDLDRGQSISLRGTLTRENAPALPWVDGIESVLLRDNSRHIWVEADSEDSLTPDLEATRRVVITVMRDAVEAAISAAWQAGYQEMEYKTSDEYARDIVANEREFLSDGTLYS